MRTASTADEHLLPMPSLRQRRLPAESQIADILARWEKRTGERAAGIQIYRSSGKGRIRGIAILREKSADSGGAR
jgi:hypothetical protein